MKFGNVLGMLGILSIFGVAASACAESDTPMPDPSPTVSSPESPPQIGDAKSGVTASKTPEQIFAAASSEAPANLDAEGSYDDKNPNHVTYRVIPDEAFLGKDISLPQHPEPVGDGLGTVSQAACRTSNWSCPVNGKPTGSNWVQSGTTLPSWCGDWSLGTNNDTCYWYRTVGGPPWQATVVFVVPQNTSCPKCKEDGAYIPSAGSGCQSYTPVWNTVTCGYP